MAVIGEASSPEDIEAVRTLMREFTDWARRMDPEAAAAPTFDGLEAELAGLPGPYAPPGGRLFLAREGERPVGCVAFRAHGGGVVEMKRMYVRPESRGGGVGRALMEALLASARAAGARRAVLDSHHSMWGAHRIYRALGFRDVPPPADFPAALATKIVFMEMALS